ncbi:MAG: nucleotidyltransferase domain-containing protein [Boseongicola sp.]|nr:nucleotidyltransferase domain-containing protein [Boseongicola sp.]
MARERIDMTQLWNARSEADQRRRHSFAGSMNWETRNGRQYLYSRKGRVSKSLGPRSDATERVFAAFTEGKRDNAARLKTLKGEMERQAGVLRALDAGRLPVTAAQTLRVLGDHSKRTNIRVVGTNALYAYEALAGVVFSSSSTATGDIDFLVDDRNRLKLVTDDGDPTGLARLIRAKVDRTFQPRRAGDFRLTNDKGYMVEFIRPQPNPVWRKRPGADPLEEGDVAPAPIVGLQWLVNAPAVDAMVLDARGFPAPMLCPDPRFWALHKLWLSRQHGRQPVKKARDASQGHLVMKLVRERLPHLAFDEDFRAKLPGELRRMAP